VGVYSVAQPPREAALAAAVAGVLGVPLNRIPGARSEWDIYDDPFHFMADGFPVSKQISHVVATMAPGVPLLNGSLGDVLVRGSTDRHLGAYQSEITGDLAPLILKSQGSILPRFLRPRLREAVERRAIATLGAMIEKASRAGKGYSAFVILIRAPVFFSNNYIQHIDVAEGLVPMVTHGLVDLKMSQDDRIFTKDTYGEMFRRYFPDLAGIPHAQELMTRTALLPLGGRFTRQAASRVALSLANPAAPRHLDRGQAARAAGRGLIDRGPAAAEAIMSLYRLLLLERRLKEAGIALDWEAL
jgi:hypothetical protein